MLVVLIFFLLVSAILFLFGELIFTISTFLVLLLLAFAGTGLFEAWTARLWDWFLTEPISPEAALIWAAYFVLVSVALHWLMTL